MPTSPNRRPRPLPVLAGALALGLFLFCAWPAAAAVQDPAEDPAQDPTRQELPPDSVPREVAEPDPPPTDLPPEVVDSVDPLLPEGRGEPEDPASLAAGVPGQAPILRAVEIRSDTPLPEEPLAEMESTLGFEIGEPLTREDVARALRNVQASGLASRVDVYVRPAPPAAAPEGAPARPGVVAEVVLRANLVVDSVRIEGDTGEVAAADLRKEVPQQAGEPLIESRLVRGVYQVQEALRRAGYFEAVVRLAPEIDEARNRARVLYRVEAGPRARVAEIRFRGDRGPFNAEELKAPMRLAEGEPYRQPVARRDSERLERWLVGQEHRTARVDRPVDEYDADSDSVVVTYDLAVGPKVTVEVRGAEMKKLKKRDLLPFLGEEGFDEALLLLAENRLRSYYQGEGHYRVQVEVREERSDGELNDGELNVVVEIDPGPVFTIEEVDFVGNEDYSDERLAELVATQPTSLLTRLPVIGGGGRLVDETLSDDVSNLQAFYALQGYVDAEVGPPDVAVVGENALAVSIPIQEGEQQKVVGVTLTGVDAFDEGELLDEMVIEEGGPFHPRILETSLDQLRSRYERLGYDAVNVSANTAWNPGHSLVDVTIRVLEGPQTVVDRVIVRGNQRTHAEVIRRAIDLDPGEPVSRSRLLEAERALYRLGLFSQVDLELTPAPLGATTRDVVVRVAEGLVRSVRYGVSVEYNDQVSDWSYGGSVGFTHANVLGRGITLSTDARILSEEEQFRLFVEQPTVGDLDVPVTYSLFSIEERRAGFRISRDGARVEGRRRIGRNTQLGLAYDYRIVENVELDGVVVPNGEDLERRDQTLRVAGFIPTVVHDRSNDPVNPSSGYTSLAQLQYAFPLFDAEADFVKLFLQHTHYIDLDFAILAASARVGGIEALAPLPTGVTDPVIPSRLDLPSQEIFLAERFFAGGGSSHRGYRPDELGIPFATCLPEGTGAGDGGDLPVSDDCAATLFPGSDGELREAGGNGLALLNLDFRFPVFGTVEGVVFFDFGNVWADWRQIDLSDFRSGSGVELRYLSPVGPLRLGVGVPLDPYPGADDYVFYVSLGSPF